MSDVDFANGRVSENNERKKINNKQIKNKTKQNSTLSKQFQNPIEKSLERGKIDTSNTHIHDRSLSWLDTGILIRRGGIKLVLWGKTSPTPFNVFILNILAKEKHVFCLRMHILLDKEKSLTDIIVSAFILYKIKDSIDDTLLRGST